jgi:hypothetical protein
MEKNETSEDDRITLNKNSDSYQSEHQKKKKTFCKRARSFFRRISLVEYRIPMYFSNRDSYKSATSGILTILSGLVLAVLFYYIFMPIFRKEEYNSEIKQIKIRNENWNGTVNDCTICRNFTVREEIEYLFNGN